MGFAVITGVVNSMYNLVVVTDAYDFQANLGIQPEDGVVTTVLGNNLTPLNFSISRDRRIVADCGDFSRFSKNGSAVVLAELKTPGGKVLGYRLLSCANGSVVNLRLDDILQRDKAYGEGNYFLQNGIIRRNTVNCYPRRPFNTITINKSKKPKPVTKVSPKPEMKEPKPQAQFTKKQLHEISLCESKGLNSAFIKNPEFTPEQMRILWVSKSNGAYSESFANPKLSVDAMKFYADRLYDEGAVIDCKGLLAHPELSVAELTALYDCIYDGVPYEEYIGKSIADIDTAREMKKEKYWGSPSKFDSDYFEKAMNYISKRGR